MSGPTREQVEAWAKLAKLPKHMRDTDAAIDALIRFAALTIADASEDTKRLDFYERNPNAIGYATGYRGSVSVWYSRKDGYVTEASSLRAAIDAARGGSHA